MPHPSQFPRLVLPCALPMLVALAGCDQAQPRCLNKENVLAHLAEGNLESAFNEPALLADCSEADLAFLERQLRAAHSIDALWALHEHQRTKSSRRRDDAKAATETQREVDQLIARLSAESHASVQAYAKVRRERVK